MAPTAPGPSQQDATDKLILITPATLVSFGGQARYIPSGTYTRFIITAKNDCAPAEQNPEIYPYKERSWVERFFVGTHHNAALSLKLVSGQFNATVPLATITHDSSRSGGEVFNRTLRHQAMDLSMFLVRGSTTSDIASVTVDLKGDDSISSSAAGTALAAVVEAAKLLSAPAPLVTTISANSNKQLATTIDSAISKLFSTSIEEQQLLDHSIRLWIPLDVTLRLPRRQGGWDRRKSNVTAEHTRRDDLDYITIGTWTVGFQTPRVSAFSAVEVDCDAAKTDADCRSAYEAAAVAAGADVAHHYGEVLAFPLIRDGSALGTIAAYLRAQDWWAPSLQELNGANADPGQFCRQVRSTITDLGFNTIDAGFVLGAVRYSQLLTSAEATKLNGVPACGG